MILFLFLLFLVLPILDLYCLFLVGGEIGFFNTFLLVILLGILGVSLAKRQSAELWVKIHQDLQAGRVPSDSLIQSGLVFTGGIFLLVPGFITDIAGLLLLIPITRQLFLVMIKYFIMRKIQKGQMRIFRQHYDFRQSSPSFHEVNMEFGPLPRVEREVREIREVIDLKPLSNSQRHD